jgi:IS6 family transposase
VLAWAHTFGPLLAAEGRRHARPVARRWWCDETYVRVGGRWAYRAIDEGGHVVDVLLREHRDLASARAFLDRAIARRETTKAIERAHFPVKARLRPMRRLRSVATGRRLLEGIELAQAIGRGTIRSTAEPHSALPSPGPHERARAAARTFAWLATRLAQAA